MLDEDLRDDLNFSAFQSTHSLSSLYMPYGYNGEPVIGGNDYIVPEGKVLVILDAGYNPNGVMGNSLIAVFDDSSHHFVGRPGEIVWVDQNKRIALGGRTNGIFYPEPNRGFVGLLFDSVNHVTPVHAKSNNYSVPEGSKLVVTSNIGWVEINSTSITSDDILRSNALVFNAGVNLELNANGGFYGFSGYLIDENRSLGGGLISSTDQNSVSGSIENGSITRDKLSEEILAELGASVSEEELNSTISAKLGSIPPTNGQLLSVPSGTEPPLGYTKISDSRIEWKVESLSNSHNYQLNPVSRGKLMSINNTLFCLNYNGSNFTLRHYDDNTSSWKNVENSTPPNSHGINGGTQRDRGWGGSFGSKIYLVGGQGYNNDSIVSVYDTETGSWSTGPNLPQYDSQYPPYVGEVNGTLYVISHIDNNNYRAFKLEEGSSSWTEVFLNFNTTRTWDGVCLPHLNSLFFVGGSSGSIIEFNTLSNDVTHVTSIPDWSNAGHSSDAAFIFGGKIYVYRNLGHFFSYDISNKSWTRVSKAPGPSASTSLVGHAMTVHKGVPWISGGDLTLSSDSPNSGTTRGFGTYSGMFVPAVYSYSGGSDHGTNLSASTSVTPSMLSDSILKYLMPEIVEQPTFTGTIRNGTSVELKPGVEGKYVSYQWYKNGEPIDGATSQLFTIESFDVGYHDGNYTVVASNDFGEIESAVIELAGNSNDFRGVDISSMNFQDQNLSEALFDSTTIFSNGTSGASFSGTGVKLSNLSGSIDLRGVNFDSADLRGSDLSQALFNEQTWISGANLSGTGAVFPTGAWAIVNANVAGVNFSASNDLSFTDTILTEWDETQEKYIGANISGTNINWSSGVPDDMRGVNIAGVDFGGQDLSHVVFDSTTIFSSDSLGFSSGASFSGTGVKLSNLSGPVDLRGVTLHGADLRGSDLSQALFNEQTFITSANLSGTGAVFPVGVFALTGSNVAGVEFEDGSQLTISSDTILTEYDEELEKYNGADIGFSNVNWFRSPDDFRGVNIAGVTLEGLEWPYLVFDSDTKFSNGSVGAQISTGVSHEQGINLSSISGIVDLRGVFLSGANLSGLDFKINDQTIIEAANLTNVNLCGKDLRQAFQYGANSNTYSNTYYDAETVFPDDFDPAQEPGLVFVSDSFTVGGGQLSAPYFTIDNDQGIVDFTSYSLRPGNTYSFRSWEIADEHSFMIGESYGDMDSSMVYRGPLTRGNEGSYMFLTIPEGFDGSLFYFCPDHSSMVQEFTLSPANHVAELNSTVSLEMIWVEPGTFTMGSPESETGRGSNETQHEVTLTKGFYLGKYEVTQAQYEAVMTGNTDGLNATPSNWPNNPDRPVEQVSWDDVQKFLTRLNAQEAGNIPAGWSYVLPSEAQWEYACRAGTTTAYSWGDTISIDNANYTPSGYLQTLDVGLYDANPCDFFDMHGNVWEWTSDWHAAYSGGSVTDPMGPATGSERVIRGGGWGSSGSALRSAYRWHNNPTSFRNFDVGFRVAFQQQ
jgi:sulfatase modifying factor 1